MKRLFSVCVAAALASIGASALAADDGLEGVRDQAKETYKMDKKGCEPLKDEERKNCLRRAKAQYNQAKADAKRMKAEQKKEKAAERAEKRDAKRRARGNREDSTAGASQRPAAGAQSGAPSSAKPEPGKGMGRAPETAAGSSAN